MKFYWIIAIFLGSFAKAQVTHNYHSGPCNQMPEWVCCYDDQTYPMGGGTFGTDYRMGNCSDSGLSNGDVACGRVNAVAKRAKPKAPPQPKADIPQESNFATADFYWGGAVSCRSPGELGKINQQSCNGKVAGMLQNKEYCGSCAVQDRPAGNPNEGIVATKLDHFLKKETITIGSEYPPTACANEAQGTQLDYREYIYRKSFCADYLKDINFQSMDSYVVGGSGRENDQKKGIYEAERLKYLRDPAHYAISPFKSPKLNQDFTAWVRKKRDEIENQMKDHPLTPKEVNEGVTTLANRYKAAHCGNGKVVINMKRVPDQILSYDSDLGPRDAVNSGTRDFLAKKGIVCGNSGPTPLTPTGHRKIEVVVDISKNFKNNVATLTPAEQKEMRATVLAQARAQLQKQNCPGAKLTDKQVYASSNSYANGQPWEKFGMNDLSKKRADAGVQVIEGIESELNSNARSANTAIAPKIQIPPGGIGEGDPCAYELKKVPGKGDLYRVVLKDEAFRKKHQQDFEASKSVKITLTFEADACPAPQRAESLELPEVASSCVGPDFSCDQS